MFAHKAFSLLELLVTLSIIAILTAIAVPNYQDYLVRAHVAKLFTVAEAYRFKVMEAFIDGSNISGKQNVDSAEVDFVLLDTNNPNKYVVEAVAKMKAANQRGIGLSLPAGTTKALSLQLQGDIKGDYIDWSCHVAAEYTKYVPANCRNNNMLSLESRE